MYLEALPLVIIGYTLLFGDLITATEVLNDGQKSRPDEPLDINLDRSHLSIAVRNFLGLLVNPFFPTQGALWTGVHVVVVERWKKGPKEMPSIFDGLGSYYLMGLPILYFTLTFYYINETINADGSYANTNINWFCLCLCGHGNSKERTLKWHRHY